MSWHFSQALAADYWQANCSTGAPSARLRLMSTQEAYCIPAKMTGRFVPSQFGTTLEPSTAQHGAAVVMWYQAAFPAKPIPQRLEAVLRRMTYGRKCGESWQRQLPGTYLPKTRRDSRSITPQTTSKRWATKPDVSPSVHLMWAPFIFDDDTGYVHTPTTKANYRAPSMQKWASCRLFMEILGNPTPAIHEWLMGWPIGWTDLKPLETDKFQLWLRVHGAS